MATPRQKTAARQNIKKARKVQSRRAHGESIPKRSRGLSTRQENRMPRSTFAFPKERKEPLNDARHVRNAIARCDHVGSNSLRQPSIDAARLTAAIA